MLRSAIVLALVLLAPAASAQEPESGAQADAGSNCNVPEASGVGPYDRGQDTYFGFVVGNCGPVGVDCPGDVCELIHLGGSDGECDPDDNSLGKRLFGDPDCEDDGGGGKIELTKLDLF